MLTFEQKLTIIETFPELTRKDVSLKRVNFQYEESLHDKKNVVFHLHPNGNGYVYSELLEGFSSDEKGMTNIRDFSEEDLRAIIKKSIESLSNYEEEAQIDFDEEIWINSEKHTLTLIYEEGMWNVYAGSMLDGTFPSLNEARQYLEEEGFRKK
ncbi:hypothetical protein [Bacillus suaedaesalsae]|uniref:Uncharacterized protein n=1 Tax=Bacillus suaedaesalsae TaxID=2810349 RepID=A0ABS2DLR3_9BACI|nr:hypothetical protein [Bacillus suaedaesalsae]MBM6619445.1 hypothetical protein [Bacillus suaedaesalsae]